MTNKSIQAIAFDLDGVLVDSCDWHRDALNIALVEAGYAEIDAIAHKNIYNGLPTRTKLEKLGIPQEFRKTIEDRKQFHTNTLIQKYCHHDEELVKIMWLLKLDGYQLACVTNCTPNGARLLLRKIGVLPFLDLLVANDFGGEPKPSPDPYVFCSKKLNLLSNSVLVVEDSYKGIEAAKRAGCRLLEVPARHGLTYQKIKECIYNDQQFLF